MEINGLPLHALVVHAAVVFGPLAALAGIAYAVVGRWRGWLRWPLMALALLALVSIWVAYLSGESLAENNTYGGPLAELLEVHEERAEVLRLSVTAFAAVSLAAAWFHSRTGVLRVVLSAALVLAALLTLGYTVLTGDAGAKIGWFGING